MRRIFIFALMIFAVVTLSACNDQPKSDVDNEPDELLELTIEELAMYDGKDGMDAYIAVNGVVYDVTGVAAWSGGTHNGNMAGTDVSDVISSAPHGDSVLDDLEVVGSIIE